MIVKNIFAVLLAAMLFAGCSPERKTYPIDGFAVAGRITYDKDTPTVVEHRIRTDSEVAPIPHAYVEVVDISDDDKVIAQGVTDYDGVFIIGLPEDLETTSLVVRVFTVCGLRKFPMAVIEHSDIAVEADTYFVQSEAFIGKKNDMTIHIEGGTTLAGAFNIFSQIIKGYKFVADFGGEQDTEFPSLKVNWEPGEEGAAGADCTCFFNKFLFQATINLRQDENDDAVILHEFGHYLHDVFSHSTNPGGDHIIACSQEDDPQLTFSEGWATGFSLIVRKSSYYIDTDNQNFFVEHEFPCHVGQGSTSETVVAAMYLDLYDGPTNGMPSEDDDTLSLTFEQIWKAMKEVPRSLRATVYQFYIALLDNGAVSQKEWNDNFTLLGLDPAMLVLNSNALAGSPTPPPANLVPPSADPEFHALVEPK